MQIKRSRVYRSDRVAVLWTRRRGMEPRSARLGQIGTVLPNRLQSRRIRQRLQERHEIIDIPQGDLDGARERIGARVLSRMGSEGRITGDRGFQRRAPAVMQEYRPFGDVAQRRRLELTPRELASDGGLQLGDATGIRHGGKSPVGAELIGIEQFEAVMAARVLRIAIPGERQHVVKLAVRKIRTDVTLDALPAADEYLEPAQSSRRQRARYVRAPRANGFQESIESRVSAGERFLEGRNRLRDVHQDLRGGVAAIPRRRGLRPAGLTDIRQRTEQRLVFASEIRLGRDSTRELPAVEIELGGGLDRTGCLRPQAVGSAIPEEPAVICHIPNGRRVPQHSRREGHCAAVSPPLLRYVTTRAGTIAVTRQADVEEQIPAEIDRQTTAGYCVRRVGRGHFQRRERENKCPFLGWRQAIGGNRNTGGWHQQRQRRSREKHPYGCAAI